MSRAVARADSDRVDLLWDFADLAGTSAAFAQAAAESPVGPVRGEYLTQQARALGLQGKSAEAGALLDVAAGQPDGTQMLTARVELERGRLLNSDGDPAGSIPHFEAARDAAEKAGDDYLIVDALHMLAIADPERSAAWTSQGLAVLATGTDARARRWAGPLRNNLGWALLERGDPDGALRQFEAALEAFEHLGSAQQVRIARWTVGRGLREAGRHGEALKTQQALLSDLTDAGLTDGFVHQELAVLLAGDPAAAHHAAEATRLLADS